jgi:hypothetical protein
MQIQWTSINEKMPEEGMKVYVQGDDFVCQAYLHEGMYWQDANVGTKRYAISAVNKWCHIDHAQSVVDSHMDSYYEQKRPNGKIHVYTMELQQTAQAYADDAVNESEAIRKMISSAYLAGYSDAVDKVAELKDNEQ